MFNFENIGGKIKILAVVITVIGIGVSLAFGLYLLDSNVLLGLVIAVVGSLLSWISSFFIYGFGELIEKTTEIAHNTKKDIKVEIVNDTNQNNSSN